MAAVPSSVVWSCVRSNSCFLVKRVNDQKMQFTTEPGNVTNESKFKYSGLANDKAVDLSIDGTGQVSMGLKAPKRSQMPSTAIRRTPLRKDFRRVANSIISQTAGQNYRADLTDKALARWTKLYSVSQIKKGLKKATPVKRGRGKK